MSIDRFRLTTEEQRERLQDARWLGGRCAACDRVLDDGEPVYMERFFLGIKHLSASDMVTYESEVRALVGVECVSPAFLEQTAGTEPERCAGCGRGVYYRAPRANRHRALCSRRCAARAATAKRAPRPREEG